jgi:hypothetical protein
VVCGVGFNQNSRWVARLVMKYVLLGKNCLGFVMAPCRPGAKFVAKNLTGDRKNLGQEKLYELNVTVQPEIPG